MPSGRSMRVVALVAALGFCGCSCGRAPARPDGALLGRDGAAEAAPHDALPSDVAPATDAQDPNHPEEAWAAALDVPWNADGTRQLTPIEIPPVVTASDCGTACRQVTFLPGHRGCTTFGDRFSVDGDYLTTGMGFQSWYDAGQLRQRCLQVYVDLRTLKAFAFGAIMAGPSSSYCGSASLRGGRIGYGCNATQPTTLARRAELRVFDIASATERLLWQGGPTELDQPLSTALVADNLASVMRPGCPSCSTVFLSSLSGGPRQQLYPAVGQPVGGLDVVAASYPYVAFADFQRFYGTGLGVEVVAVDLRQPSVFIDLSNSAGDQWMPRMSGTRVVWVDTRNAPGCDAYSKCNYDIYVKDIVSGQERAVCTDPAAQNNADIDGDTVGWLDCREADDQHKFSVPCFHPYIMNLSEGVERRVDVPSGWSGDGLRLNGGRLFFFGGPTGAALEQVFVIDLRALGLVP